MKRGGIFSASLGAIGGGSFGASSRIGSPSLSLIVLLNFFDSDAGVWLPFQSPGAWVGQVDGTRPPVQTTQNDQWSPVVVASNYGGVYK